MLSFEPDIVFVLPDHFRGPIVIVEDEQGVRLQSIRGVYIVVVPAARVVRVRSFFPFNDWHKEFTATSEQFAPSGRSLVNLVPRPDEVALRCLGTSSRGINGKEFKDRLVYFLGTEKESADYDVWSLPAD